jgi:antitoxin component YwqK of YwqJK toxin-antitoxin module
MLGYKIAKSSGTRVLVTLEIPSDAKTNITRCDIVNTQYAKHRCDRALVMSIEDSEGNKYSAASSSEYLKKQLVYTTGQIVYEPAYTLDLESVCGEGIHFFLSKEVALLYGLDKIKNGVHKRWWNSGQLMDLSIFIEGEVHGVYKAWHNNGQLWKLGTYASDKLHGEYKEWYSNGQLQIQTTYKNDKIHGLYMKWNHTGTLILKCDYTHGKRNGEFKSWHCNGNPHLFCTYKDGKLHGKYTGWHLNGTLHTNCFYISDKLVSEDKFETCILS